MEKQNATPSGASNEALADPLDGLQANGKLAELLASAARSNSTQPPRALAGDILYGADQIAEFLYGDRKCRRKVYNLIDGSRLPHFRLGASICARRSVLFDWIVDQEGRFTGTPNPLK